MLRFKTYYHTPETRIAFCKFVNRVSSQGLDEEKEESKKIEKRGVEKREKGTASGQRTEAAILPFVINLSLICQQHVMISIWMHYNFSQLFVNGMKWSGSTPLLVVVNTQNVISRVVLKKQGKETLTLFCEI